MSTNMWVTLLNKCVNKHGGKWQHSFSVYIQVLVVFWISQLCPGKIICYRNTAKISLKNQAEVNAEGDRKQPVDKTPENLNLKMHFEVPAVFYSRGWPPKLQQFTGKKYLEFSLIFTTNAVYQITSRHTASTRAGHSLMALTMPSSWQTAWFVGAFILYSFVSVLPGGFSQKKGYGLVL